jgi:hypothetical protein
MLGMEKDCLQLSPTELYIKLSYYAQEMAIDVKAKGWPRSPGALTRRLNLVSVALKAVGCEISSYEGTPRLIKINVEKLTVKEPEAPKRYCSEECENYDSLACSNPVGWDKLNEKTEIPCKCPGYAQKDAGEDS